MQVPRSLTITLGLGIVIVFALTQFRLAADSRPVGTIEDLPALAESPPNVVFILIDTLRADRLGSYGYDRPTSPTLDALASSGIRFSNHLAQSSWTKASMASLWTGLHPVRTGVLRFDHALPTDARMPAEIFREAGFETAALWRNGWVAPNFGFSQGFDLYQKPRPVRVNWESRRENPEAKIQGSDADITEGMREFLRVHHEDRWLLYLHYMDVHQYLSDEESAKFGNSYSDLYDNSIHWVDRHIEGLLAELDYYGLREETLIVVAADHGEAFGEHGSEGHARTLYGEVTGTPFLLSLPFRLEGGLVVDEPSQNVDIFPTVLELLGLPFLPETDGRSLVPSIRRAAGLSAREDREEITRIAHLDRTWGQTHGVPRTLVAATRGAYRFVAGGDVHEAELYDLREDPGERENLASLRSDVATEMRSAVRDYLEGPPSPWGGAISVEVDDMQMGQLRALGYVLE